MTAIPRGWYAVPDPDDPGRMTYWAVDGRGAVRDFPHGARCRPLPPLDTPKAERQHWYDTEYRAWLARRDLAILTDLDGTAARFRDRYPNPDAVPPVDRSPSPPRPRVRSTADGRARVERVARERAIRDAQALVVAALRAAGHSFRAIADVLNVPLATVHRRAERGAVLSEVSRRSPVEQLAAQLTRLAVLLGEDDDRQYGMRAAARALLGDRPS